MNTTSAPTEITWPDGIVPVTAEHGLAAVEVSVAQATGRIYTQGAHVAAWTPTGADPVLWMSATSMYAVGSPLRGGIPICAPWFGPGRTGDAAPAHGFFRLVPWRPVAADVTDGAAVLTYELTGADAAGAPGSDTFPDDFTATYRVRMGTSLTLELTVTAGGSDLDLEEALHTYLAVSDVRAIRITGLDGTTYLDKVTGQAGVPQTGAVTITAETDRVYTAAGPAAVVDPGVSGTISTPRTITITTSGSATTVVWNPWVAKSAAMPDFGDDEWPGMVCVETANALDAAVRIAPGASHTLRATISLT